MFRTTQAFSSFAVDDVLRARAFYGETLGLEIVEAEMGAFGVRLADGAVVFVYPKGDHTPATFTVLNFRVGDVDAAVDALTRAGVGLERYEGDMGTDERGVFRGRERGLGPTIAWFRDPAGNILSVLDA